MINCNSRLDDNIIYLDCSNSEGYKNLLLTISDLDNNLKLIEYNFDIFESLSVWSRLTYGTSRFSFVNGYKLIIINVNTKEIEYEGVLLTKPYTKTKFIDKDNILTQRMSEVLNDNFLSTIKSFSKDSLNIKNDKVLIDLGSTIGVFTAYALDQNPDLKSICIEMNPNLHKICVDTFKDNPNIIPINAAIYKVSGETITFKSNKENFYDLGNTIVDNLFNDQTYSMEINTVSMESIMRDYNIDRISLLKVDIEGYEYELFDNLSDEFLSRIDKIFLEFHHVVEPNRKLNLINRLMINGFKMKIYDDTINFYSADMYSLFFSK